MKEDVKMKDILNAGPKGTMPQVGAMQHMQASPKVSPAQASPKVSPAQATPKASPIQNTHGVMPMHNKPNVMAEQFLPNVMPAETMPQMLPMQKMSEEMPVQAGPGSVMPSMMYQIPIMCCPYLMNMQCPMTYGSNQMLPAVSPTQGNMMPYTSNTAPVMGPANNMYPMPGTGTLPESISNPFLPMGGMNY